MNMRRCILNSLHGYFSVEWHPVVLRLAYLNGSRERQARLQMAACLICGGPMRLVEVA